LSVYESALVQAINVFHRLVKAVIFVRLMSMKWCDEHNFLSFFDTVLIIKWVGNIEEIFFE